MNKYKKYIFETLPSTNKYLKDNYNDYDEFSVIIASNQTSGKGRMDRKWISSKDNIAMSILLKPRNIKNISNLSLVVGASVFNTLKEYVNAMIKWPNDIIVNNKKICGILLESISSTQIDVLVLGIGLNVNQKEFDNSIKDKATSLRNEINTELDIDEIIDNLIINFDILYNDFASNGKQYIDIVRDNLYLKDEYVYINDSKALIKDIDGEGNLVVLDNGIIKHLYSGEVTLTKNYS